MVRTAKIAAAMLLGYSIAFSLNWLGNLFLPQPELLKQQPALAQMLQQQDVTLAQWQQSVERLNEKRRLKLL